MGIKLFDDVDDEDVEKISKIEVNKEFAKRYEHNKKREDLQKLEEMKKKGLVHDSASDSESETESDFEDVEDDVKNTKKEVKFLDALLKVRNKDPILQEKDVKLFDSSDDDDDDDDDNESRERKEKREKPKYLKDVIAQRLIERDGKNGGDDVEERENDDEEEEDEDDVEEREERKVKSYVEEQEELRKEVLKAMAEAENEAGVEGEGGELLKEKEREDEEEEDEEVKKRLDEFFGEDEKLDEKDMFLKDFFKNKLWIDREKGKNKVIDDEVLLSDDEEAIEKQEDYERDFNFRFEENASDRVLGHSRFVDGSVRKETNARKNQRERKKERLAQAEVERQEEVKRLKNLKRKEMQEKLNKIREIAGIENEGIPLNEDDLEEEFDPEKFDKKMSGMFGKEYYDKEDVDPGFGSESESDLEKPDFEKEDELLGLPKDWEVIKSSDGFLAERERMKQKSKVKDGSDADQMIEGEDDGEQLDEGKRRRKRKKSAIKEALDKELEEELYKLDYEDSIGDLKTRFKYREVKPSKYRLSAAEILALDEKELNQYVSLKKLAPYREKEWKVPQMRKEMLYNGLLRDKRKKRKGDGSVDEINSGKGAMEAVKAHKEEPSVDESKLSRAARRRRKMKEKKLPESRLIAYGKMPASSKNKSKS